MKTGSGTSCTTNDITRQVEKHLIGKDVRQMSDHSPFGRKSTPLVMSRAFAAVFSWTSFIIRCLVLQVSLPRFYSKAAEIMGSLYCSFCLEKCDCVRPSMAERIQADQQSACQHGRPFSLCSCMSAWKTFFIV